VKRKFSVHSKQNPSPGKGRRGGEGKNVGKKKGTLSSRGRKGILATGWDGKLQPVKRSRAKVRDPGEKK